MRVATANSLKSIHSPPRVSEASVVHTTVDVNIQEAWTHAPKKTKCETTHIVKCETEIYRVKPG